MSATTGTDLVIDRADLSTAQLIDAVPADAPLATGQVMVEIRQFGLTTNNMSYASAGDRMGYWNFFPAPDPTLGRLPVWGYAQVVRSEHSTIAVGEELFGFLPLGRRFIAEPTDVDDLCFSDCFEHRAALHPWYNRYYRTAADPVTKLGFRDVQPVMWALFMTGWELANEFVANANHGADTVLVASASSKTAYSFAKALKDHGASIRVVAMTSPDNRKFVEQLGCYDEVRTYDALDLSGIEGAAAFVDMAGNQNLASAVHSTLGDQLVQSIRVGGTHRGAGGPPAELPGPERRFFFIPDVAEAKSGELGHSAYHATFADAWSTFAPWAMQWMELSSSQGPTAMLDGYRAAQSSMIRPTEGLLFSYD